MNAENIIVFDAHCVLCNGWVRFILRHDYDKQFHFAAVTSEIGKHLLEKAGIDALDPQSMLLKEGPRIRTHTDAIIRVLTLLGGWKTLALLGRVIPSIIRDPIYLFVARRRYRWFGRTESCALPETPHRERFLH